MSDMGEQQQDACAIMVAASADESVESENGRCAGDGGSLGFIRTSWANPARWLYVTGWIAMILFAFLAFMQPTDVGDTWVAMACGRHFVHHGVTTVDPFSMNSLKAGPTREEVETWPWWARWVVDRCGIDAIRYWHPTGWINQNWLSHVLFYKLATTVGTEEAPNFNALLYLKCGFYLLTVLCLYHVGTMLGASRILAAWCACFAMCVGLSFTGLRPADFSNLFVPAFILILVLATYRSILYIWLIVPLVVLWGNLHGGYIYVFIMFIPFLGWHLVGLLPKRWGVWLYSVMGCFVLLAFTVKTSVGRDLCGLVPVRCLFCVAVACVIIGVAAVMIRALNDGHLGILHMVLSSLVFALAWVRLYPGKVDSSNIRGLLSIDGGDIVKCCG